MAGNLHAVLENRSSAPPGPPARPGQISVCHIASGDLWAGAEVQVASLIRYLARRQDLLVSAILLNEGRMADEVRACGIDVKVIPEGQKNFLQILREAVRHLRGRGTHILHSHRYKGNLLARLLANRCRVPITVLSQHGLPEPFKGLRQARQRLLYSLDRLVARYATDAVISVSAELQGRLARGIRPRKIVMIHNGIDIGQVFSKLSPREAKERLGIPGDCPVVGTAGRLEPVKRLDIFLAAAKLLSDRMPGAKFLIAGDGREQLRLRDLARSLGLEERVRFLGHHNDIYDVLRAFDVVVLSSDHEGLPMVLLETLYLGVPVIARPVGGVVEVVQHDVNGVLVEPGDPLALADACFDLLADPERRRRLAQAGPVSVAAAFTAERAAAEVAELYFSLCGVRGHGI